jgi:hypothetical protein
MKRINQLLRTLVMDATVRLMNLNSGYCCYAGIFHDIGWRDHLRWWIEGHLLTVFSWAYEGSDEELQAIVDDEIPEKYWTPRQRAFALTLGIEGREVAND